MKKLITIILTVIFFLTNLYSEEVKQKYKGFESKSDIVYKVADGVECKMDIIFPKEKVFDDGAPVVMFIHGGGWHSGSKVSYYADHHYFCTKGAAYVTISYRLINNKSKAPSKTIVRDCIIDCKDAARFLAKNAKEFGVNPNKIAVYGHSAGGHLALMEVLAPNKKFKGDKELAKYKPNFACAVGLAPIVTFFNKEAKDLTTKPKTLERIVGVHTKDKEKEAIEISPLNYLNKKSVPLLIIQGDDDDLVDVKSARIFVEKAKSLGLDIEYIEVKDAWHNFRAKKGTDKTPSHTIEQLLDAHRKYMAKKLGLL